MCFVCRCPFFIKVRKMGSKIDAVFVRVLSSNFVFLRVELTNLLDNFTKLSSFFNSAHHIGVVLVLVFETS